jgi:hypothetical protein
MHEIFHLNRLILTIALFCVFDGIGITYQASVEAFSTRQYSATTSSRTAYPHSLDIVKRNVNARNRQYTHHHHHHHWFADQKLYLQSKDFSRQDDFEFQKISPSTKGSHRDDDHHLRSPDREHNATQREQDYILKNIPATSLWK